MPTTIILYLWCLRREKEYWCVVAEAELPTVSGSAISRNCCRNMLNLSMAKPSPMSAIEVRTQDKKVRWFAKYCCNRSELSSSSSNMSCFCIYYNQWSVITPSRIARIYLYMSYFHNKIIGYNITCHLSIVFLLSPKEWKINTIKITYDEIMIVCMNTLS